jgi:hypothetical protein
VEDTREQAVLVRIRRMYLRELAAINAFLATE